MANYYGQARTNHFAVKDAEKFLSELEGWEVEVFTTEQPDGTVLYGFLDSDSNGGGLSWVRYYEDADGEYQEEERDWIEWLGQHVADGHVAVLVEIGSEKYRYLNGTTWAINSKGESMRISLDDIYELATKNFGQVVTTATY